MFCWRSDGKGGGRPDAAGQVETQGLNFLSHQSQQQLALYTNTMCDKSVEDSGSEWAACSGTGRVRTLFGDRIGSGWVCRHRTMEPWETLIWLPGNTKKKKKKGRLGGRCCCESSRRIVHGLGLLLHSGLGWMVPDQNKCIMFV